MHGARPPGHRPPAITRVAALALVLLAGMASPAPAAAFNPDEALGASRAAVGREVANHHFFGLGGRTVSMHSLRGKPLIVSLVYTSCYGSCSIASLRLAQAVAVAREALGKDSFRVLTVGFDAPNDTPQRMAIFARQNRIKGDHWQVLSTDSGTAAALARDVGFTFETSPRGFDHVNQVTILDADGRVYRQIYGDDFKTPLLVEPLKELVWGTSRDGVSLEGWVNGLKLLCTVYDPSADRYKFDYSIFVGAIVGLLCLGAVGVFVVRSWSDGSNRPAV